MTVPLKKLDISALTETLGTLAVRDEKPEEMASRLEQETADGNHTRWKDRLLFVGCGGAGLLVLLLCLYFAIWGGDADTRRWAQSLVGALMAGVVGYLVGKK